MTNFILQQFSNLKNFTRHKRARPITEDSCQLELGTIRTLSCPRFPPTNFPSVTPKEASATPTFPFVNFSNIKKKNFFQTSKLPPSTRGGSLERANKRDTIEIKAAAISSPDSQTTDTSSLFDPDIEHIFLIKLINRILSDDEDISDALPLDSSNENGFGVMCSGVIPCKLLNRLIPDSVDTRALNISTGSDEYLSVAEMRQNHILCINSLLSQSNNCEKLLPEILCRGNREMLSTLLWQIINTATVWSVDVRRVPALRVLQEDDEDIFDLLRLSPEALLIRWANFMLHQIREKQRLEGQSRVGTFTDISKISNLSTDLMDCRLFLILQNRINEDICKIETINDEDRILKAREVINNFKKLGIECYLDSNDILLGNSRFNAILLSQLFCYDHGLQLYNDISVDTDPETFDDEGSREERTFRMWMNSLGCETSCMNLFSEDFTTGWMLLEVCDIIQPGCVDWTMSSKPPFKKIVQRIKSVENCNQVIRIARDLLNLSLVGICGADIADGKKKPILALVWQIMRFHTLQVLKSAFECGGSPATPGGRLSENDVLAWANQILELSRSQERISSFRDPLLSNSLAMLDLLKAIEPNAVQHKFVSAGKTYAEKELNAKYVISIARKLGAAIFIVWEDITEVHPKMLLILVASIMLLDKQRRKMQKEAVIYKKHSKQAIKPIS